MKNIYIIKRKMEETKKPNFWELRVVVERNEDNNWKELNMEVTGKGNEHHGC